MRTNLRNELNLSRVKRFKSNEGIIKNLEIYSIFQTTCNYFNIPIELAMSKTRKREVVKARQIAMYFSKNLTKSSLAAIGSQIGDKDHATCLHAIKTVNNLIDTDKHFKIQLDEIKKQLKL